MGRRKKWGKAAMAWILGALCVVTGIPFEGIAGTGIKAEAADVTVTGTSEGYRLSNGVISVETGKYGQITSLKIDGDSYDTNYVMNAENASGQNTATHEWMGELMLSCRNNENGTWSDERTNFSDSVRKITADKDSVEVSYKNATEEKGIKSVALSEKYGFADGSFTWEITLANTGENSVEVGDLGLPLP